MRPLDCTARACRFARAVPAKTLESKGERRRSSRAAQRVPSGMQPERALHAPSVKPTVADAEYPAAIEPRRAGASGASVTIPLAPTSRKIASSPCRTRAPSPATHARGEAEDGVARVVRQEELSGVHDVTSAVCLSEERSARAHLQVNMDGAAPDTNRGRSRRIEPPQTRPNVEIPPRRKESASVRCGRGGSPGRGVNPRRCWGRWLCGRREDQGRGGRRAHQADGVARSRS